MAIKLYDLAGAEDDRRFSPYCWRVKMALVHKGLAFETVPWRFTEKDAIAFANSTTVPVLVEVNIAGEATKQGAPAEDVPALVERLRRCVNLDVRGLMTVAPQVDDPEDVRAFFRELRELRDSLGLRDLSMGMTGDFEVAIEEGATLVRVGRAIFGSRPT